MKSIAIRGIYKPKNTEKTPHKTVVYRSLWERRFMLYCDKSPRIVHWINEPFAIPYIHENKQRNYYPDFLITLNTNEKKLIEIKPHWQKTWQQNKDKWNYAKDYCKENNITFQVLTEHELF